MKLTSKTSVKRKSGMTLIELTVVILVLLSLISILFVGARAWKKGSDRSANIMNIRNVQQAVRGHQNMLGLAELSTLDKDDIVGPGKYLDAPTSPIASAIAYDYGTQVPAPGTLYLIATYTGTTATADYAPPTTLTAQW